MSFPNRMAGLAAAAALLTVSTAASADVTRASSSVPRVSAAYAAQTTRIGERQTRRVKGDERLLGAPLFLLFLGAAVVTIGTIIIVNNNDSNG